MARSAHDSELMKRIAKSDPHAVATAIDQNRESLKRLVRSRLDRRLQGRLDPSDVVQESCLEAVRRLEEFNANPDLTFDAWLRRLTWQKVLQLHRLHLKAQVRDARKEVSLIDSTNSSVRLAELLSDRLSSPSHQAMKNEEKLCVQEAIDQLSDIDAEIIELHHFDHLSLAEAAELLGISHPACCNRYFRAVKRVGVVLGISSGQR